MTTSKKKQEKERKKSQFSTAKNVHIVYIGITIPSIVIALLGAITFVLLRVIWLFRGKGEGGLMLIIGH